MADRATEPGNDFRAYPSSSSRDCAGRSTRRSLALPARPPFMAQGLPLGGFDFDINTSRQTKLIECLNRLGRGLNNVDQTLVGTNLKLLPRLLVNIWPG